MEQKNVWSETRREVKGERKALSLEIISPDRCEHPDLVEIKGLGRVAGHPRCGSVQCEYTLDYPEFPVLTRSGKIDTWRFWCLVLEQLYRDWFLRYFVWVE